MTSSTVDDRITNLQQLINAYEHGKLKSDLASLKRQLGIEASVAFGVPIIATILSAFVVNLTAMLFPIIIGAANIADKLGLSKTMMSSYFKDKDALQARPESLRALLKLAKTADTPDEQEKMLKTVRKNILDYYSLPQT
jgi:energy-converting hydrogenase Eha subunit A